MTPMPTHPDPFWRHVKKGDDCWNWTAGLTGKGYGAFWGTSGSEPAHRHSYELLVGPIPSGHDVHHTCDNRTCVNPAHLLALPHKDHAAFHAQGRSRHIKHCPHGHPYDPANTYVTKRGVRQCRTCDRDRKRDRYHRAILATSKEMESSTAPSSPT